MAESEDYDSRWEKRWSEGSPRWDKSAPHPALTTLLSSHPELRIPTTGRALVPGCGRGYDVQVFAERGLDTVGLDFAPTGVNEARRWLASQPSTSAMKEIKQADFFEFDNGPFDLIYDYTFLCALHPTLRPRWASHLASLSVPGTTLITLMFPLEAFDGGPPWSLSREVYHQLLDGEWECVREREVEEGMGREVGGRKGEMIGVWKRRPGAGDSSKG